jgi:hypothetical protein
MAAYKGVQSGSCPVRRGSACRKKKAEHFSDLLHQVPQYLTLPLYFKLLPAPVVSCNLVCEL